MGYYKTMIIGDRDTNAIPTATYGEATATATVTATATATR